MRKECQKLNHPWKIVKQLGDVVDRIKYFGIDPPKTRRHNQIKHCLVPTLDPGVELVRANERVQGQRDLGKQPVRCFNQTDSTASRALRHKCHEDILDTTVASDSPVSDCLRPLTYGVLCARKCLLGTRSGRYLRPTRNPEFEYYA